MKQGEITMRKHIVLTAATLAVAAIAWSQMETPRPPDRRAVETIVHEYLLKNPSVIREALAALGKQEEAAAAEATRKAIAAEGEALMRGPAEYLGSAEADVTVIEFFDYRCGYCKQLAPVLARLVEADKKVRVVLKELPILGPESEFAAKAALAARPAGKYLEFHRALMANEDLSEKGVRSVASRLGIGERVFAGLDRKEIDDVLSSNAALAERLAIRGTPGLIIGDRLVPGALSYEALTELVAAERVRRR